jgi:hypothetical protein
MVNGTMVNERSWGLNASTIDHRLIDHAGASRSHPHAWLKENPPKITDSAAIPMAFI